MKEFLIQFPPGIALGYGILLIAILIILCYTQKKCKNGKRRNFKTNY
jgi:hypothetical protein